MLFGFLQFNALRLGDALDDNIKWKHFSRYWPFVRGIHRSPVIYPHEGQWRGALMFSLMCSRINGWVNMVRLVTPSRLLWRHCNYVWLIKLINPSYMFLSLDLLWEYQIQHGANGPLYVTSSYSTCIFCRGVSGFATDCPCGVWCRGLTTCLLHVGSPFVNRILNNSWAVGLT